MKLIKPSYSIIPQESGLEGIYKNIELAARNCYKSEPVEGVTSKDFVDRMIKRGHLSTLEHGTVYLMYDDSLMTGRDELGDYSYKRSNPLRWLKFNKYSKVVIDQDIWYVTTNYRVLVENNKLDNLEYLCEPTEFHEKRVTVKFTSNIHFYKDITRHRKMSFAIESTRYCNYSKGKFGSELTFIIPVWMNNMEEYEAYYGIPGNDCIVKPLVGSEFYPYYTFLYALLNAEESYMELVDNGWTAQQAAEVLPQATKADVIMTGFVSDWKHVFDLRTSIIAKTGKPFPEVSRLMDPLYNEFIERKWV